MKKILATRPGNWSALFARLALGITVFPHGAQKLLNWFGGPGFNGSIGFLTGTFHLPWIIALLVILIESIGAVFLFLGFGTRIMALAIIINFLGVVFTTAINNGFFMNWYMQPDKPEGLEYFILLFGLALVSLIAGGGKASIDAIIMGKKGYSKNEFYI